MEHVTEGCTCTGKRCSACEAMLCIGHYTKDNDSKDKLKHKCRKCANLAYAEWSERTAETGPTRQYKKVDPAIRFFSKVEKDTASDCWLWMGSKKENGYGMFTINRKMIYAHRWSYEHHKEAIPNGLEIDHKCRVRHCVNPDHLEVVTRKINMQRSISPSTENGQKTHCKHGHEFAEENTIRTIKVRRCRTCAIELQRNRYVGSPRIQRTQCIKCEMPLGERNDSYCADCRREIDTLWHKNKRHGLPTCQVKTHCRKGHPYNEENTYIHPTSGKHCRICKRERASKYLQVPKNLPRISKERGYTLQEWRSLKARYNYTCLCCGRREPDIKLVADHVLPKSIGGSDEISNRQPLCKVCNSKKKDKFIDFRPETP